MKVISYSVFRHPSATEWEYRAHVRGMCFNIRMNKLLYPGWETAISYDAETGVRYGELFGTMLGQWQNPFIDGLPLCEYMLHRMIPVFNDADFSDPITHVLCRDADAITTYREACAVNDWLNSGKAIHGINDNPAHSIPLMGGMIGIDCEQFRNLTGITSFNQLIEGYDLSQRGSDQQLLMERVWQKVQHSFMLSSNPEQKRDNPLWESDLTCRHIGSAGVVELELLRFFHRHDAANQQMYDAIEKQYPEIFYYQV